MILQCDSNNEDIIVNNIKIIANDSGQEYVLTKLKIISFSNVVNINVDRTSILVNRIS